MKEYLFGQGDGHLPAAAQKVAEKHGAHLVNSHHGQCRCGRGCDPRRCPQAKRHWFAGPNRGEPFDRRMAEAVMDDLDQSGILPRSEATR